MKKSACMMAVMCLACAGVYAQGFDFGKIADTVKNAAGHGGKASSPQVDGDTVKKVFEVGKTLVQAVDNQLGPVEEFYLGREVGSRLLAAYPGPLAADDPVAQYVSRVGATVALGSRAPYLYRPYTFVVLKSNECNAYAAPGGIIFVTTGMLQFVQNEDELAGVLGHEVAHIELRHGVRTLEQEGFIKFLDTAADTAISETTANAPLVDQITGPIADQMMDGVRNGYSVEQEGEADARGLELCLAAGYDPNSFAGLLARFESSGVSTGGPRYPKQRAAAAQQRLSVMPQAAGMQPAPQRTERYQTAVGALR